MVNKDTILDVVSLGYINMSSLMCTDYLSSLTYSIWTGEINYFFFFYPLEAINVLGLDIRAADQLIKGGSVPEEQRLHIQLMLVTSGATNKLQSTCSHQPVHCFFLPGE